MIDALTTPNMGHLSKTSKFLADLVIYNKYANYLPDIRRRQVWEECVTVLMEMHIKQYPKLEKEIRAAFDMVYIKQVLPSMRSIQFGGIPIEFSPNRIFNCAYAPIDHYYVFAEFLFLLLGGTGQGYSVRSKHVSQLPEIVKPEGTRRYLIGDSIEGWADSMKALMAAYMKGKPLPKFDYRDIRPKGSLIKKTGGRAPGHTSLEYAHNKVNQVLNQAIGRKLTTLETHDIVCFIADCVLAGGVREAALISLFDISDTDMITSKGMFKCSDIRILENNPDSWLIKVKLMKDQIMNTNCYNGTDEQTVYLSKQFGSDDFVKLTEHGELAWYYLHPQRGRANNSVALLRGQVSYEQFREIWQRTEDAKSGDPGILWVNNEDDGTNPCSEIGLIKNQFCNLTTAVVYNTLTQKQLNEQMRVAAFIGTLQAGYTDFHYLRPIWKEATEKDALIGVSMTGVASGRVLPLNLTEAAGIVVEENKRVAAKIGINQAARTTCMKPEGTGTLAAGVMGSGIHAIHSEYLIRNVRIKKHNPIYGYLMSVMPEYVHDEFLNEANGAVVSIPMKAPEGVILRTESTFDMLERIKRFSVDWVKPGHRSGAQSHNVSATVTVDDGDWSAVADWMWENREFYNGITVLPRDNGSYKQAPFEEISEEEYEDRVRNFPKFVDFTAIEEEAGHVNLLAEKACVGAGGSCEI